MDKDGNGNVTKEEFINSLSNQSSMFILSHFSFSFQDVTLWMSHIGANYDTVKEDTTTHLPFYVHRKLSVSSYSIY